MAGLVNLQLEHENKKGQLYSVFVLANSGNGLLHFRKELLLSLVQSGVKVIIGIPECSEISLLEEMGCQTIKVNVSRRGTNPFSDFRLLNRYKHLLNEKRPDVVLTYTIKPNVYGGIVCQLLHIPYIVNVTGIGSSIEDGGILQKISLFLYKLGLRKAEKVFFQNQKNLDFFRKKKIIKNQSVEVLPGSGVNLTENCYEPYPESDSPVVFNTIGRIMKDKGIFELLSAARTIKKEFPQVVFRLVGGFDENCQEIIERAQKDGIIEYLGHRNDIHELMKESHATIHPSYHEGMSNVLLESAACGRPVLATNVPGCIEAFDSGVSGLSFKPKNADDLVRAISEFMGLSHAEREAMGKAGRKKMEKNFDRQIVVDKYMNEIARIEEEKNEKRI